MSQDEPFVVVVPAGMPFPCGSRGPLGTEREQASRRKFQAFGKRIQLAVKGFLPLAFLLGSDAQGAIVYDNLATARGNYLGGFGYEEAADDVTLGPGPRVLQQVEVAYAGFNFDGDETLTLTLYEMDGAPTLGSFGFNTPGTVLYSQTVPIAATNGDVLTFIDSTESVILSEVVGIGIAFGGVDFDTFGGSDAGPLLYDPPVVGSSLDDYWLRGFPNPGDPWGLFTFGGNPPINFGVRITAIPEPGASALLGLSLAGFAGLRRRRR